LTITYDDIRTAKAKGKAYDRQFSKTLISAAQGHFIHPLQLAGSPGQGAYGGAKAAVQILGNDEGPSHPGVITFPEDVDPEDNFLYFCGAHLPNAVSGGILWLIDLLVEYGGFSGTAVGQQSTGVAAGTNNLPRWQDGVGVMAMADVQSALGVTPQNLSIVFTADDNTTGNASVVLPTIASCPQAKLAHANHPYLPITKKGIKSVQSAGVAASTGAGTFAIVLFKILAMFTIPSPMNSRDVDFVLSDFLPSLPRDVALSFLWSPGATSTATLNAIAKAVALDPNA
jgi:hypothetical protein